MARLHGLERQETLRLRDAGASIDPQDIWIRGVRCRQGIEDDLHGHLGRVVRWHRAVDEDFADSLGRELGRLHAAPGVNVGLDDARRPLEVLHRPVGGGLLEEAVPHRCGGVSG